MIGAKPKSVLVVHLAKLFRLVTKFVEEAGECRELVVAEGDDSLVVCFADLCHGVPPLCELRA